MRTIAMDAEVAPVNLPGDASLEARKVLAKHPHFRGRANAIVVYECDQVLMVHGQVPSFYLKQVLQTVLRDIAGITRIDNRVDVVSSDGLSSVRRR